MTIPPLPILSPVSAPFRAYAVCPIRREYLGWGVGGLTLFHTRRGVWNGDLVDSSAPAAEPWMRCTDVRAEGRRRWRCQLPAGHQDRSGATDHRSFSGHRSWPPTPTASASVDAGHNDQGAAAPARLGALVHLDTTHHTQETTPCPSSTPAASRP